VSNETNGRDDQGRDNQAGPGPGQMFKGQANRIAVVERMLVVASKSNDVVRAQQLFQLWSELMKPVVVQALQDIDACEQEIVWYLQHADEIVDADKNLAHPQRRRAHALAVLTRNVKWLATELATTWLNDVTVKRAAEKAVATGVAEF